MIRGRVHSHARGGGGEVGPNDHLKEDIQQ